MASSKYILSTISASFYDAEASCQRHGGHLVSYDNQQEQYAVEQCFLSQGTLLPNYHRFYWMGLRTGLAGASWPNFTWINHEDAIYVGNYQHWGVYQPGLLLEPNNQVAPEDCAGSNLTMGIIKIDKTYGHDSVGGWADHNCQESHPYVCEVLMRQQVSPDYTSSTGSIFSFHPDLLVQQDAEHACNEAGGHLASYSSVLEQSEVEQYFVEQGFLLPGYHTAYWLGLVADRALGSWRWLDFLPAPSLRSYQHWGSITLATGRAVPEPNNLGPPETCAVANASQAFDEPAAWGWADANCGLRLPFICKLQCEHHSVVKLSEVCAAWVGMYTSTH
jgi:hypothetical protein